ncbi:MAG: hypothetical protein ACK5Z5_10070 [Neisseriaceae bacterium]
MNTIDKAKDKTNDTIADTKNTILEYSSIIKDKVSDYFKISKEKMSEANQATIKSVKDNPYKALGVAVCTGFVLTKICNLVFSSRNKNK